MKVRYLAACLSVLMGLSPSVAQAEDPSFDNTGRGAVLCIFLIHIQVLARAEHCSPKDALDVQGALRESIADMEEFIVANSSHSQKDVARYRAMLADRVTAQKRICEKPEEMFEAYRRIGADAIRASTREMLAVPREPKGNPCL